VTTVEVLRWELRALGWAAFYVVFTLVFVAVVLWPCLGPDPRRRYPR
jgi:cbb3-type cytochrome oxidase subunit 3